MAPPDPAPTVRPGLSRGRKTYLFVYGCCLLFGATALFGSIGLQLWGPTGAHDGARPHRHRVFCTGQLCSLRQELEDATLQDLSHTRRPGELARIEAVRRRTWRDRLAEVTRRCADLPAHTEAAQALLALESRYADLLDAMHAVRGGMAAPLDEALHALKE